MDDIKPSQSMDGMRGPDPNRPDDSQETQNNESYNDSSHGPNLSAYDVNRTSTSRTKTTTSTTHDVNVNMPQQQVAGGAPKNRGLKVLLTLFIILFLAAAGAAAYFYTESQNNSSSDSSAELQKLEQENESLRYDNKTLVVYKQQSSDLQNKVQNLKTTAQQLKTKCGSSCKVIVIPD